LCFQLLLSLRALCLQNNKEKGNRNIKLLPITLLETGKHNSLHRSPRAGHNIRQTISQYLNPSMKHRSGLALTVTLNETRHQWIMHMIRSCKIYTLLKSCSLSTLHQRKLKHHSIHTDGGTETAFAYLDTAINAWVLCSEPKKP